MSPDKFTKAVDLHFDLQRAQKAAFSTKDSLEYLRQLTDPYMLGKSDETILLVLKQVEDLVYAKVAEIIKGLQNEIAEL